MGRASERDLKVLHLEQTGVSRSIYESLPVQNSVESMDIKNFNAIVNRTECLDEHDEANSCRHASHLDLGNENDDDDNDEAVGRDLVVSIDKEQISSADKKAYTDRKKADRSKKKKKEEAQ